MIDNIRTGRNIIHYRRLCGWTQGELARRLNVTHQAVSKWENAVALPDISTLLALSQLFGVSMEDLLTGEPDASYENDILLDDEQADEAISDAALDEDDSSEPQPDPEPSSSSEPGAYDWDAISRLAPFASSDTLDEMVRRCEDSCDMKHIYRLAPFLRKDTLDRLIRSSIDSADWTAISRLAPFASSDTLDELVRRCEDSCDMKHIYRLAPFLRKDTLDRLIRKSMNMPAKEQTAAPEPAQVLESFAPFLQQHIGEGTLNQLLGSVASRSDRRRTEIRNPSPELTAFAQDVVRQLYASCDATDPIIGRFEEIHQALESQDYGALNEFSELLGQHIGPEWLEKYSEICDTDEPENDLTQKISCALENRDWGWIEDNADLISDQQLIRHIVRVAASEGFFDFIPLFIDDLDQSLIDYAAQQAVAHHALDDILPFRSRVSPGILD